MKNPTSIRIGLLTARALALLMFPLFLAGCGGPAPAAASKNPASPKGVEQVEEAGASEAWRPQAVFQDLPHLKDPFFPQSARRVVETASGNAVASQNNALMSLLSVRAIIGVEDPRAWINSRTFAAGEEGEVRLPTGERIKIKCLEIHPDSVRVEVEGIPGSRELPLRLRR